jgi:hypothetical protein
VSDFSLLIYAAADELYEHYVAPYIFFALSSNPNAISEVLVSKGYFDRNSKCCELLQKMFGNRLNISEIDFSLRPDVSRFTLMPSVRADYVYMGDIDLMIVEPIMDKHLIKMKEADLPYSNIVRKNFIDKGIYKLTGLHFTEFDFHFPVDMSVLKDLDLTQYGSDENALYAIVNSKGKAPSLNFSYRPLHGLHLSQHGFPLSKTMGWGLNMTEYLDSYLLLANTVNFALLYSEFAEKFKVFHELVLLARRAINAYGDAAYKLYPFMGGR